MTVDKSNMSAMERHWNKPSQLLGRVRSKDLVTGKWQPPTPLLARVQGAVCVFPPGFEKPIWVPERCIRHVDVDTDTACSITAVPDNNNLVGKEGSMSVGEKLPPFDAGQPG